MSKLSVLLDVVPLFEAENMVNCYSPHYSAARTHVLKM